MTRDRESARAARANFRSPASFGTATKRDSRPSVRLATPRARGWARANPERARARKRAWYEEHAALTIARASKWTADNPERRREIARNYAAKNRAKQSLTLQVWREKNRDMVRNLTNKWHTDHAAELRAKRRQWRKEHPEQARARDQEQWRRRRAKNAETIREWYRKRYVRCRDDYLAAARNRRASKVPAPGTHTAEDIPRLYEAQAGKCAACHVPLSKTGKDKYSIDHIVPLKPRAGGARGTNDASNLQLLCRPCNRAKSNLSPDKWATRIHGTQRAP
jgi:5-methylcytosine-specific restriction endonuclease McrA